MLTPEEKWELAGMPDSTVTEDPTAAPVHPELCGDSNGDDAETLVCRVCGECYLDCYPCTANLQIETECGTQFICEPCALRIAYEVFKHTVDYGEVGGCQSEQTAEAKEIDRIHAAVYVLDAIMACLPRRNKFDWADVFLYAADVFRVRGPSA
jgi:hypothetical protein